ncbi:beta family protein [Spirilliplanes yamanashiensis]|uniref:T4 beta protein n=1 Tax=Spirilliplanes yamanashiensis TaxID=42233 RepID=A0A8J3YBL8_9ACTN|nr:beta family protein [Spirilliplanes yamanashiensis]MDP9816196.1 hypothetical protein [Spirilliplanes yamanashiensis]GIJ05721.1 hypothetical protein Sya03_50730 [Spirilliplanes yamanashiensis]
MPARDPAREGGPAAYRPVLRARRGELVALHHLDPGQAARVAPVLEPVAAAQGAEELTRLLRELPPATPTVAVDTSVTGGDPLLLGERLGELGIAAEPVLRSWDDDRRLAQAGLAAKLFGGRAVFRFQPYVDVRNAPAATELCRHVWSTADLAAEQMDLLVDLADVGCAAGAARFGDRTRRVLRWARGHPWRSITLVAGAMPANLDELPSDEAVAVERFDARFFAAVADEGIGYGDYGVTSPLRRHGVHHRQLPTLRYATGAEWWIYRWSRRGGRPDDRCHDLCRTLVGAAHWPAAGARFSWGDAMIARRARTAPGAGSPASWMAWSTSHHIAQVLTERAVS